MDDSWYRLDGRYQFEERPTCIFTSAFWELRWAKYRVVLCQRIRNSFKPNAGENVFYLVPWCLQRPDEQTEQAFIWYSEEDRPPLYFRPIRTIIRTQPDSSPQGNIVFLFRRDQYKKTWRKRSKNRIYLVPGHRDYKGHSQKYTNEDEELSPCMNGIITF